MTPAHTSALFEAVSQSVYAYQARPHWSKVIPACTPRVDLLYGDDAARWESVRRSFDPHGVFLNDWYDRHIALDRTIPALERAAA